MGMIINPMPNNCILELRKQENRTQVQPHNVVSENRINNTLNYIEALKNYNISFTARLDAIYAIDTDGNYQRFLGVTDASRKLNMPHVGISRCLSGIYRNTGGYFFIKADSVETKNEKGEPILDENKLKEKVDVIKNSGKPIKTAEERCIYAVDSDGNYKHFNGVSEAAKELNLIHSGISFCLSGKYKTSGGYYFVYANAVETQNENGESVIDEEKLKLAIEEINKPKPKKKRKTEKAIYAVAQDGTYKRYRNISEAAEDIGAFATNISVCLKDKSKRVHELAFILADDVETTNKDGDTVLDDEKFQQQLNLLTIEKYKRDIEIKTPIYAIDENANTQRFNTITEATTILNLPEGGISQCINGKSKSSGGYVFKKAVEFETIDENGNIVIDEEKLKKAARISSILLKKAQISFDTAIYSIDKDGNYQRYSSIMEAEEKLGISQHAIDLVLNGSHGATVEYGFVRAKKIETISKEGEIVVNKKAMDKAITATKNAILSQKNNNGIPIYVIDKEGNIQRYMSTLEASREISMHQGSIADAIKDNRMTQNGYFFIKASDIETTDKNNRLCLNYTRLQSLLPVETGTEHKKAERKEAVYSTDRYGNIQRYNSAKEASNKLEIAESSILECTNSEKTECEGYIFFKAEEIETQNKDSEILIDIEQMEKWKIFGKTYFQERVIPRPQCSIPHSNIFSDKFITKLSRLGRIYALDNHGNYREFETFRDAVEKLDVDADVLYACVKGNKVNDSIKGMVFTCDLYA